MLCGHTGTESLSCCCCHSLFVKDFVEIARPWLVLLRGANDYAILIVTGCCCRHGANDVCLTLLVWPDRLATYCSTIAVQQVIDMSSAHLPHPGIRQWHSNAGSHTRTYTLFHLLAALVLRLQDAT